MWPDWVSNLGPLALESDVLPSARHDPSHLCRIGKLQCNMFVSNRYFFSMMEFLNYLAYDKRLCSVFCIRFLLQAKKSR